MNLLLRGLLIGFAIAAPVGPIGILCINRTLIYGRWTGFLSGVGAASADALYGAVAVFGLKVIEDMLVGQKFWMRAMSGVFLLFLGVRSFLSRPAEQSSESAVARVGSAGAYLTTFVLTVANPATIISFTLIFAGLGSLFTSVNFLSGTLVVAGVFLGSAAWWLTLSLLVGFVRGKFSPRHMVWVNRFAGLILCTFGAGTLLLAGV